MAAEKERTYIEDIDKTNFLKGYLVRAKEELGKIIKIDIPKEVLDYPDFYIAGYDDIPGKKTISIEEDEIPLFAKDVIEYPGQPIFIAAHPDRRILQELCDKITIEVEPIKSVKKDKSEIYKRITGGEKNIEKLFSKAQLKLKHQFSTGTQNHYSLGHQGAIAIPSKEGVAITLSSNLTSFAQESIAATLNVSKEKISIIPTKRPHSFGMKNWYPVLIGAQVALLARKVQKSIRLVFTKEEDLFQTTKRTPIDISIETALDKENNPIAKRFTISIKSGAFPLFTNLISHVYSQSLFGFYEEFPIFYCIEFVKTKEPAMDFFSGYGLSPLFFAIERDIDLIAKRCNFTPLDYRLHLINPLFQRPIILHQIEYCLFASDYKRKQVAYNLLPNQTDKNTLMTVKRKRGIGIAFCWQGAQLKNSKLQNEFFANYETYPEIKSQKNNSPFNYISPGILTIEVEVNPISFEIVPLDISIALQVPIRTNKKAIHHSVLQALLPALRWATTNQNYTKANSYIDLTITPLKRLPNVNIQFFEAEYAIEAPIVDLVFSLVAPAFAAATSQAIEQQIKQVPILAEHFFEPTQNQEALDGI